MKMHKLVSFSIVILLILSAVLLACKAAPTPAPTAKPAAVATVVPKPTAVPAQPTATSVPAAKETGQPVLIKISHTSPAGNYIKHWWPVKFKEIVEARTNGRVKIEIYPLGQLYKEETEAMAAVSKGDIQITLGSSSNFVSIYEGLGVFGLPGLFTTSAQVLKFSESPNGGQKISEGMAAKNITIIGWLAQDQNKIWGVKKWSQLADMQGKKVRCAPSKVNLETLKALGATGVSVPTVEVYTALQQGVADGAMTISDAVLEHKWYEALKSTLEGLPLGFVTQPVFVNKKYWESFPAETGSILKEAAKTAQDYANAEQQKVLTSIKDDLIKKTGMEFNALSKADVDKAISLLAPVLETNRANMGSLIDDAQKWR